MESASGAFGPALFARQRPKSQRANDLPTLIAVQNFVRVLCLALVQVVAQRDEAHGQNVACK